MIEHHLVYVRAAREAYNEFSGYAEKAENCRGGGKNCVGFAGAPAAKVEPWHDPDVQTL